MEIAGIMGYICRQIAKMHNCGIPKEGGGLLPLSCDLLPEFTKMAYPKTEVGSFNLSSD